MVVCQLIVEAQTRSHLRDAGQFSGRKAMAVVCQTIVEINYRRRMAAPRSAAGRRGARSGRRAPRTPPPSLPVERVPIVHLAYSADDMPECPLRMVRRHPGAAHQAPRRAAEIVDRPAVHAGRAVERRLELRKPPSGRSPAPNTKRRCAERRRKRPAPHWTTAAPTRPWSYFARR